MDTQHLRQEGMKMESAARSGAQISSESSHNRVGKYSFNNLKERKKDRVRPEKANLTYPQM